MNRTTRLVFLGLIALAAALATASVMFLVQGIEQQPRPAIGGAFTLTDQDGRTVTQETYKGRAMLVFFGFTNCPDVCPMTLQRIADAFDAAPELKTKVTPVLVSVDPGRDTPAKMKEYVGYFGPEFVGLTGTPEQIGKVLKTYGVYAKKVEMPDSALGYTMDHSSLIYLYGPDGAFVTTMDPSMDSAALAAKLKENVN